MVGFSRSLWRGGVFAIVACVFVSAGGCQLVADLNRFDVVEPSGGAGGTDGGMGGAPVGGGGEGGIAGPGGGGTGGSGGQGGQIPCDGPTGTLLVDADATGAADGTSWADAYPSLADGLAYVATCGNVSEVWVADGTYTPGSSASDTFALQSGLSILGGFDGTETMADQRDPDANLTILAGDVDGNDGGNGLLTDTTFITGTNALHVVTATGVDATAVLDGFAISGGDASGSGTDADGAGILVGDGTPTLRDLLIQANEAVELGGGIAASDGGPVLVEVRLIRNRANAGGGMHISGGTVQLTDAVLDGNVAVADGGGAAWLNTVATATGATITGNAAAQDGGGLYVSGGTATLIDVRAAGNESSDRGGFLRTDGGMQDLTNAVISGNDASSSGGAMYVGGAADVSLTNVTVQGNHGASTTGGLLNAASSGTIVVQNSIFWFNSDSGGSGTLVSNISNAGVSPLVRHAMIEAAGTSGVDWQTAAGTDDGDNVDLLPELVDPTDPANAPTTAGDHRLRDSSPLIDLGDQTLNSETTDLGGNPRVGYADIDLGAYELYAPCNAVTYVNDDAAGADLGDSWADAFVSLRRALRHGELCALASMELWVAAGSYTPHPTDRTASFLLRDDVAVYGGFAGNETMLSERDPTVSFTVLSGDIDGNDTVDGNGIVQSHTDIASGGTNSLHVVRADGVGASAVLDGVVVTAGRADLTDPDNRGAGLLLVNGATPTLANLTFAGNDANAHGGGVYHLDATAITIDTVTFNGNRAGAEGGGLYTESGTATLLDVVATNNTATRGGAIKAEGSEVTVTRGTFRSNTAAQGGAGARVRFANTTWRDVVFEGNSGGGLGGALFVLFNSHTLENVAFVGNSTTSRAGAFYNDRANTTITNATFHGNKGADGGAVYFDNTGQTLSFVNTILWANLDVGGTAQEGTIFYDKPGNLKATFSHCIVQGSGGSASWDANIGTDGGNNVDMDPMFVNDIDPDLSPQVGADLHLDVGSPALHTGTTGTDFDIDGVARPQGAGPDMGIYEQ
jgi:predicted outer membrane repeat protein